MLRLRIGELMAHMHILSLENKCEIGCGTLFSAAYWNDVDAFYWLMIVYVILANVISFWSGLYLADWLPGIF